MFRRSAFTEEQMDSQLMQLNGFNRNAVSCSFALEAIRPK
jgi:hypothetical protein